MLRVDHVIYAVRDADAAAERIWREHGLASIEGGRHPAWGTANRIIPLGSAYFELMTVFDPEVADATPLGRFVVQRIERGDSLIGWMVTGDGLDERLEANRLEPAPSGRRLPDGSEVTWRLAGLETMIAAPPLPGFIEWDKPEAFPGLTEVEHRVRPTGIAWLELAGDERRITSWLGEDHGLPLRFADGQPGLRAAAIALEDGGEIVLR